MDHRGRGVALIWIVATAALWAAAPIGAAELSGQISIASSGQALRSSETTEAVVYFRPTAAFAPPAALPTTQMATRRKEFVPRVLAITPGTEVRFPNLDPILHNAFSGSPGNIFDTGVYGNGEGSSHVFESAGLVKVYCNVHHSMNATILVLDTPWFTRPDAQGRFRLQDLPEGPGDLVVYHDRTSPWQQRIEVGATAAEPLQIHLELTRRKVPPHMNKFGKPYGRRNDAGSY
ncbi:MAG: hypothetical protein KDJ14_10835 [Xanthomonadales bacterium]|nr:hypothetical protein [Xanthomonadales bacterium]